MLIATNIILEYGRPVGITMFNTETCKCTEIPYNKCTLHSWYKLLPQIDGITMQPVGTNNTRTILLGKSGNQYVVTSGSIGIHTLDKSQLVHVNAVNFSVGARVRMFEGAMPNLDAMFRNDTFICTGIFEKMSGSSGGNQKKLKGALKQNNTIQGIIKFPLINSSKDTVYEVLYKIVGDKLGIPVVRAIAGYYNNKHCVLSVFEYNAGIDKFDTVHKLQTRTGKSIADIMNNISNKTDYMKSMILDYLFEQEDRHYRNLAICNNKLYPLYDNGRCLRLGMIGHLSSNNRLMVERNIIKWYKANSEIRTLFSKFKQLGSKILPKNYNAEYLILKENFDKLEGIINERYTVCL